MSQILHESHTEKKNKECVVYQVLSYAFFYTLQQSHEPEPQWENVEALGRCCCFQKHPRTGPWAAAIARASQRSPEGLRRSGPRASDPALMSETDPGRLTLGPGLETGQCQAWGEAPPLPASHPPSRDMMQSKFLPQLCDIRNYFKIGETVPIFKVLKDV